MFYHLDHFTTRREKQLRWIDQKWQKPKLAVAQVKVAIRIKEKWVHNVGWNSANSHVELGIWILLLFF